MTCKILSLKGEKTPISMELNDIDHNYAEMKSIRRELEGLIQNVSHIDELNENFINIMTSAHEDLSKSTNNSLGNIKSNYADQLEILTENARQQLEQITYTNDNKMSQMDKQLTKQTNDMFEINKKLTKQSSEISNINKKFTKHSSEMSELINKITSAHNADVTEINNKLSKITSTQSSDHRTVQDQINIVNDKLTKCGCC